MCALVTGVQTCALPILLRPGRHADPRGPPDPAAIPLRPLQAPGPAGDVPLAPGLRPAGECGADLQRLRHPPPAVGRLRRRVRRVPTSEEWRLGNGGFRTAMLWWFP